MNETAINERFDRIDNSIERMSDRLDHMSQRLDQVTQGLERVTQGLDHLTKYVLEFREEATTRLQVIESRLDFLSLTLQVSDPGFQQ